MIRLRQIKLPVEDSNIDKIKYECAKKLKINLDKIRKIKSGDRNNRYGNLILSPQKFK